MGVFFLKPEEAIVVGKEPSKGKKGKKSGAKGEDKYGKGKTRMRAKGKGKRANEKGEMHMD